MQVYDSVGYICLIVAARTGCYADRNPVSSIIDGSA
jgi:hypothetical protein